jgi:redox-sensitive bicupin YhaK (pirin superfamily)
MLTIRKSKERGHGRHGWLDSRHTFSFAGYFDRRHTGFRALRVINEDRIEPGRGFDTHSHRDMEILTYIVDGALEHKDSMGNGSVIHPGDVQRMSAGTGVTHSEFNPSPVEVAHLLQIWIVPQTDGLQPSYEQKHFAVAERSAALRLVASQDGRGGSVRVHQDVDIYATLLAAGQTGTMTLRAGRGAWVQIVRGSVTINDAEVQDGDGVAIENEPVVEIACHAAAELVVFDLA